MVGRIPVFDVTPVVEHGRYPAKAVAGFPDAASVQYLRETGVTTVLLIRNQVGGTPWERAGDVPVDALGIRREDLDDNTVIFRLS